MLGELPRANEKNTNAASLEDKPHERRTPRRIRLRLQQSQAKPFCQTSPAGRVVYLEPEVAKRFADSNEVNRLLKAIMEAMPVTTADGDVTT